MESGRKTMAPPAGAHKVADVIFRGIVLFARAHSTAELRRFCFNENRTPEVFILMGVLPNKHAYDLQNKLKRNMMS